MKMEDKLKRITDFLDRVGINYTVDRNPSLEKVEKIRTSIKRREELEKFFVERYKEKNEIIRRVDRAVDGAGLENQ